MSCSTTAQCLSKSHYFQHRYRISPRSLPGEITYWTQVPHPTQVSLALLDPLKLVVVLEGKLVNTRLLGYLYIFFLHLYIPAIRVRKYE